MTITSTWLNGASWSAIIAQLQTTEDKAVAAEAKLAGIATGATNDAAELSAARAGNASLATRLAADKSVTDRRLNELFALARRPSYEAVRVATTANISLLELPVVDGVQTAVGDRILVKDQTNAAQNGIYIVGETTWNRASDMNEAAEFTPRMLVPVREGTANAQTVYELAATLPVTVGTTAISFARVASLSDSFVSDTAANLDGQTLDVGSIGFGTDDKSFRVFDGATAGGLVLPSDSLRNRTNAWFQGKAPAVIDRSRPRILMPENYIGLETQIVYAPAGEFYPLPVGSMVTPTTTGTITSISAGGGDVYLDTGLGGVARITRREFTAQGYGSPEVGQEYDLARVGQPDFTGVTDFASALTAMREEIFATLLDSRWPATSLDGSRKVTTAAGFQPGLRYYTTGRLDLSGLRALGFTLKGHGASLIYAGSPSDRTGCVLDMIGAFGLTIEDLMIETYGGGRPNYGILMGRRTADEIASLHSFKNVTVNGWFEKAAFYNYASEVFRAFELDLVQHQPEPALIIDHHNTYDINADTNATVTAAVGNGSGAQQASCLQHDFYSCRVRCIQGSPLGALRILSTIDSNSSSVRKVRFFDSYVTNDVLVSPDTGSSPAVVVRGNVDDLYLDIHAERQNPSDGVVNLSHILLYDNTGYEQVCQNHTLIDHMSDAEVAVIDCVSTGTDLYLHNVNFQITRARGVNPGGAPVEIFGPNMQTIGARVTGMLSVGDDEDLNEFGDIRFHGTLVSNAVPANMDFRTESEVRVIAGRAASGGYQKLSRKQVTAAGLNSTGNTLAFEDFSIIEFTGVDLCVVNAITANFRYRTIQFVNSSSFPVKLPLTSGSATIPVNGSLLVVQAGSSTYAASPAASTQKLTVTAASFQLGDGPPTRATATLDGSPLRGIEIVRLANSGQPNFVAVFALPAQFVGYSITGVELMYTSESASGGNYGIQSNMRVAKTGQTIETTDTQFAATAFASTSASQLVTTAASYDTAVVVEAGDIAFVEVERNAGAPGDTATDGIEIIAVNLVLTANP